MRTADEEEDSGEEFGSPFVWDALPLWKKMRALINALTAELGRCKVPIDAPWQKVSRREPALYQRELMRREFLELVFTRDPQHPLDLEMTRCALGRSTRRVLVFSSSIEEALTRAMEQAKTVQRRLLLNEFFNHRLIDFWDERLSNSGLIRVLEEKLWRLEQRRSFSDTYA